MSSLSAALHSASGSLDVLEQTMAVLQNNVTNASTPGYVTQTPTFIADSFDPSAGLSGGVQAGAVESSRNQYAEESVWNQNQLAGSATQQSTSLSSLDSVFDVSGQSGVPAALSNLYSAFSAWSTTPTDITAQQQVISETESVAQAFNQAATNVQQIGTQTDQQLSSTVSQINSLSSQIAAMNGQIRNGDQNDAGLQANLYNSIEQLSNLTNISVQNESDGTVSVLMGGQTPLVLGTTTTQLNVTYPAAAAGAPYPNATPNAAITTASGQDVTSTVNGGQLAALVQFRNVTLPSVIGNSQQQGSLNELAQAVADGVNSLLTSGQTSSGAAGVPLFTYTAGSGTTVAATLAASTTITGSQLAAADPGPPLSANGIASQLAGLSNSTNATLGSSYTAYYSNLASNIGNQASSAATAESTQSQLLTQAQNVRAQVSGVSLNDMATDLTQFQEAYQASAQMITIINTTTQYLMTAMQDMSS